MNKSEKLKKLEESRNDLLMQADQAKTKARQYLTACQDMGYRATMMARELSRCQIALALLHDGEVTIPASVFDLIREKKFKLSVTPTEAGDLTIAVTEVVEEESSDD